MNKTSMTGFTLLEVVVAFAILAITVTTLLAMFGNGIRRITLASDYQRALFAAESRMAYLQGVAPAQLPLGSDQGVTDEGIYWQSEVDEYEDTNDTAKMPLYRIVVHAGWDEKKHRHAVTLATLRMGER